MKGSGTATRIACFGIACLVAAFGTCRGYSVGDSADAFGHICRIYALVARSPDTVGRIASEASEEVTAALERAKETLSGDAHEMVRLLGAHDIAGTNCTPGTGAGENGRGEKALCAAVALVKRVDALKKQVGDEAAAACFGAAAGDEGALQETRTPDGDKLKGMLTEGTSYPATAKFQTRTAAAAEAVGAALATDMIWLCNDAQSGRANWCGAGSSGDGSACPCAERKEIAKQAQGHDDTSQISWQQGQSPSGLGASHALGAWQLVEKICAECVDTTTNTSIDMSAADLEQEIDKTLSHLHDVNTNKGCLAPTSNTDCTHAQSANVGACVCYGTGKARVG
ncbi:hypothetical protein ERJ75_001266900 [Trypanosoma vivax]|nr:hypothetical protein ERJ75_001266900 [Trypanosoma vivax]